MNIFARNECSHLIYISSGLIPFHFWSRKFHHLSAVGMSCLKRTSCLHLINLNVWWALLEVSGMLWNVNHGITWITWIIENNTVWTCRRGEFLMQLVFWWCRHFNVQNFTSYIHNEGFPNTCTVLTQQVPWYFFTGHFCDQKSCEGGAYRDIIKKWMQYVTFVFSIYWCHTFCWLK